MNHLGFIVAAYAIGVSVPSAFVIAAWMRMRSATRRLHTVDPRRQRSDRKTVTT
jgi:hypothetical protein